MRRISVKDIAKALKMRYSANMSLRQIATATKLPHTTVADYCKRYDKCGRELNELLSLDDNKVFEILFGNDKKSSLIDVSKENTAKTKTIPDVAYIHQEIAKKGVTFELLWMEYKENYPDGYGLSQFKEHLICQHFLVQRIQENL